MKPYEKKSNFKKTKSLGQNFLQDENAVAEIIDGAQIGSKDLVIEIGPGMGVLTGHAIERAARVVAIEIDKRLIPILEERFKAQENFRIISDDILKTDLPRIISEEKSRALQAGTTIENVIVIGNLPYYITTPIIKKLLGEKECISRIIIMMQKEVADRIVAVPATKAYGAISVAVQFSCDAKKILDVSREAFSPVPKVDSAVVRLDIKEESPVEIEDEKAFEECVRRAFSKRRKTLRNCFTGMYGMSKEEAGEFLTGADIDPSLRGEVLDLYDYARLSNHLVKEKKNEKHKG